MPSADDLAASLQAQLDKLSHEASLLRAALEALDGHGSNSTSSDLARPVARKPKAKRTRRKRSAKPTVVVPSGKLEMLLAGTDGVSTVELVEQTNGDPDQVLVLLRELEAAGKVRRSRQRRETRWHAV